MEEFEFMFRFYENLQIEEKMFLILFPSAVLTLLTLVGVFFWIRKKKYENHRLSDMEQDVQLSDEEFLKDSQESNTKPVVLPFKKEGSLSWEPLEEYEPGKVGPGSEVRVDIFDLFKRGLNRTRSAFSEPLKVLMSKRQVLSKDVIEKIHETLFRADVGIFTADFLTEKVKKELSGKDVGWEEIRAILRSGIVEILNGPDRVDFSLGGGLFIDKPTVLLIVGVNGVGKTTTIAKLTSHFLEQDKKVLLGAADTFRAAAVEQLKNWGERLGVDVVSQKEGADPASVAFDTVQIARSKDYDLAIIDTAGRLHARKDLMDELGKIHRSMGKAVSGAPHHVWLVIDATTGQNALAQVKAFTEVTKVSGLIVTKLDGTAKGGVVIGACHQFNLPVYFIGLGEKAGDLKLFDAEFYADGILG